jgi:hypothetical protein
MHNFVSPLGSQTRARTNGADMNAVNQARPERTAHVAADRTRAPLDNLRGAPRLGQVLRVREVSSALSRARAEAWESLQANA